MNWGPRNWGLNLSHFLLDPEPEGLTPGRFELPVSSAVIACYGMQYAKSSMMEFDVNRSSLERE
eukprot:scaffold792_cov84-Cylindrotheca_fusiformis.AAC.10